MSSNKIMNSDNIFATPFRVYLIVIVIQPSEQAMNLHKYRYSHSNSYKKDPNDHRKKMNFKGEVYEASFFESMVSNIEAMPEKNVKIISKGPYTPKNNKYLSTGFYCDNSGKCIYNNNRISMAEFDCIILDEFSLFFYECTITKKPENLRSLEKESLRKSKLLKNLFPDKDILCVVVSDNEKTLKYFENKNEFSVFQYNYENIDLFDLANKIKPKKIAPTFKMLSANSLNKKTASFNYVERVKELSFLLINRSSLLSIERIIFSSNGLFERLYWGKISVKDFNSINIEPNCDLLIVSVNFKDINKPKIRYYYLDNTNSAIYEALNKPKKLNSMKSSRLEIIKIEKKLPVRSKNELQQLEIDVLEWHKKYCSGQAAECDIK